MLIIQATWCLFPVCEAQVIGFNAMPMREGTAYVLFTYVHFFFFFFFVCHQPRPVLSAPPARYQSGHANRGSRRTDRLANNDGSR